MPDTFTGLVLFVLFLSPGICFAAAREARRPQRELSAFRETAAVVLVGAACNVAAAGVLALVRVLKPEWTPDVGAFARGPAAYFRDHLVFASWWGLGLVTLACTFGVLLGLWKIPILLGKIRFESAWYTQMHYAEEVVYCGCHLDDGSWVGGYLSSFNTDVEETADRELVLTQPMYRGPDQDQATSLGVSVAVVSARRLVLLSVSYMEDTAVALT